MKTDVLLRYVSLAKFYASSGKRSECLSYLHEIERHIKQIPKVSQHTYFHKR